MIKKIDNFTWSFINSVCEGILKLILFSSSYKTLLFTMYYLLYNKTDRIFNVHVAKVFIHKDVLDGRFILNLILKKVLLRADNGNFQYVFAHYSICSPILGNIMLYLAQGSWSKHGSSRTSAGQGNDQREIRGHL